MHRRFWRVGAGLATMAVVAVSIPFGSGGTASSAHPWLANSVRPLSVPTTRVLSPVIEADAARVEALADLPGAGRTRVPTSDPVHRTLTWLEIVTQENDEVSCSGTIVGDGTVLTSAHCIDGAKSVRVVPGKDGANEPWGSQYGSAVSVPAGWGFGLPADYAQYDIGLVILPNKQLTDATGIFPGLISEIPLGAFADNATEVAALGYPGECLESSCSKGSPPTALSGTYAWAFHAGFARADESFVYPDFPGAPGMSGAPIIRERDTSIVGVVDSALFVTTQGVRIGKESREFIQEGCDSFPVCSIEFGAPWFRRTLPALAADTVGPPVLTGQALYCAREIAFVDAFTGTEIKFAQSMRGLFEMELDPSILANPNLKAMFMEQVGLAVADALAVKALESPDARFTAFEGSLDAGIDDLFAGLLAVNDAINTGNFDSVQSAVTSLAAASAEIAVAQAQYPSIDPVCLN